MTETRPALSVGLARLEFERWYWLRQELAEAAREFGLPSGGDKRYLATAIAAHLDGAPLPERERRTPSIDSIERPFSLGTVIPAGQRSTQELRAFFEENIGSSFRFDGEMRGFLSRGGATLSDAIAHWFESRNAGPREIDEQFELNRFSREWHAKHPGEPRESMMQAWKRHRSLPVDAR